MTSLLHHEVQGLESAYDTLNNMFHHLELSITKSEALFMTSWTHLLQQMSNDLTHFFSPMHQQQQHSTSTTTTTTTTNKDRTDDSQTQAKCYHMLNHWYENLRSQKQRYQTMIENERTRRKQQWKQESNDFMKRTLNQIEKHSEMMTPYSKSILKPSKTDDHQRVIYFDRNNGKNHSTTGIMRTFAVQTTKQDVELRALQRLLEYFNHQLQTCIINREQGEKMNKIQKDVKRIKVAIEELEKDIQKDRKTNRPPQQHRELKQSISVENSLYQTNDILLKPSKFDDCNYTIASQMYTRANPKYPQLVLPSTIVPDEEDNNDTCIHSEDTGKRGRGPKSVSSTPSPSLSSTFLVGKKLNFDDEEVKKVSPSVPTPSNGCIGSHIPFSKNKSYSSIEVVDECRGRLDTLKNQNLKQHLNSDRVSSLTMIPIQNLSLEDKNFSTLDMEMFEADIDKRSPSHLRQTCYSQESSPLTTRDMLPLVQTTPPPTESQFIMEQASKTSPPDRPHGLILKETRKIENIHYSRPDKHLTPNHCDLRNSWSLRVENQAGVVTHNEKIFDIKQDRATLTHDISELSPILKNGTTNNGLHPQGANRAHHRPRNVTLSPNFATTERENSFDDEHEWLSKLKGIE